MNCTYSISPAHCVTELTVALGAFLRGAREMKYQGTFNYTKESAGFGEISELLAPR